MFGRIRRATDQNDDGYGLREDWTASVDHITRVLREQAPLHGLAGISEGATVGSVLLVRHTSGDASLGSGFRALSLIGVCALTSPAHAKVYRYGTSYPSTSLHLVGDSDTGDIHHMVGRTAALFGSSSGVGCFTGGHKLPTLSGPLCSQVDGLHQYFVF